MEARDSKLPYYKINKLLWKWRRCDGAEGCRPVSGVALSMDKAPPLKAEPAKLAAPRPIEPTEKPDPIVKMVHDIEKVVIAFSRFKKWLETPDPPKLPKPPKPKPKQETVPTFDIQEIPGAMRKEFMPVSAKLMERWFAGELNYAPTDQDERNEINQDGKPYPPSMYDTTTVRLDWVLKHSREPRSNMSRCKALNCLLTVMLSTSSVGFSPLFVGQARGLMH